MLTASLGYLSHHRLRYPDKTALLASVNAYMTAYASRESVKARKLKTLRQQPDEDGFITVTKGGRNKPAREEEAREKLEKQKERQKGLEDFYRFQGREKRKERERELVRRFEEDKEKVRKMREGRGGGRAFRVCDSAVGFGIMKVLTLCAARVNIRANFATFSGPFYDTLLVHSSRFLLVRLIMSAMSL